MSTAHEGVNETGPGAPDLAKRLNRLHPKIIDLSLDRIERLLNRLGNPECSLPPVVHVAGTNGKGSVIAFARAMAEAAGQTVHAYTSPHLVRFNERIRVAGREIDDALLLALIEECETTNGDAPITFFEMTTAVVLLAFARTPADLVLLETGLGGRLDATNVVACPALTALTPISIDHVNFLGDSLDRIAAEKAGILKAGVSCVVAAQDAVAKEVIMSRAEALSVPLITDGEGWEFTADDAGLRIDTGRRTLHLPAPGLTGAHQAANAAQAVTIMDQLKAPLIGEEVLAEGLTTVDWPARLQRLDDGDLAAQLPDGWELWLDGGHNAAAGSVLANQAAAWNDQPLYLIAGILNSKDPTEFLTPLAAQVACLTTVPIPGEAASVEPAALAQLASDLGFTVTAKSSVAAAISALTQNSVGPARILICGSLYLAGHVLAIN